MPKTILLVEDDEDVLDILHYMLSDEGYSVLKSKGDDAFALAQKHLPDLILLDHRLQTGWGDDICRKLKNSEPTQNIPVIMVSATMHLEDTARAAGADAILRKPFDMEELLSLVTEVLNTQPESNQD